MNHPPNCHCETCNAHGNPFIDWDGKERRTNFQLTKEEVEYLVNNIQHEYLGKETYYFARDLFNRMEAFLKESK